MANLRFMRTNQWDAAANTLGYSSQDASYPATNTRRRWFRRPWRTQGGYLASQWLKISNLAGKIAWQTVVIFGHNLTSGASVKVQASDDNFATTPVDATVPVTADVMVYSAAAQQAHYAIRVLFSDASNPDNFISAGRIFVGLYHEPRWGFNPARRETPIDPSVIGESEHGQETSILRTQYAEIAYEFDGINASDQAEIRAHIAEHGTSRPFFLTEYPSSANPELRTYYVRATAWEWKPVAGPAMRALAMAVKTER